MLHKSVVCVCVCVCVCVRACMHVCMCVKGRHRVVKCPSAHKFKGILFLFYTCVLILFTICRYIICCFGCT